jgi:hypothetical protein
MLMRKPMVTLTHLLMLTVTVRQKLIHLKVKSMN